MTAAELGRRMSSAEFAAWLAYDAIQPIGPRRLDLNFALLRATIASALSGDRCRVEDFDVFDPGKARTEIAGAPRPGRPLTQADAKAITRVLGGIIK